MKNPNKTYAEFLNAVSPAAFSMFGTTKEKEITRFKTSVSGIDVNANQSGYIAHLLSDRCIAEAAFDCLAQIGLKATNKAGVKNQFVAAWIAQ